MAQKPTWGRAWRGRSYDLGRMTLPELWQGYATYPAIAIYVALAILSGAVAIVLATNGQAIAVSVVGVLIAYPLACTSSIASSCMAAGFTA